MITIKLGLTGPTPGTAVKWYGSSKALYEFELYPLWTEFKPLAGVYIFCRLVPAGAEALYVGETQSFFDRLYAGLVDHDGYKRARPFGVTHVAVMRVNYQADRLLIETDLRHGLNPVCNRQSNPVRA